MPEIVDRNQVQELIKHGAQLVEVLSFKQYQRAHLPGAMNLPLAKLNRRTAAEFDKDRPIIVYCYDYQ
jgi:rhodanese-related sulfurtransferase